MHGPMGKFFKTLKWHCEVSISSQRIREVREIPVLNDELVIRALRIFNGLRSVFSLLYDWKWLQRPSCGRSNAKDEVVGDGQFGQSVPYVWNPAHEARVGFLSREDSSHGTRWFPVAPCFVFHTLNAYDDGDRVCVDMCRYAGSYDVSLMTGPGPVTLDRWTIDPVSGKVTLRSLSDRFFHEFPRVDDRVIGRPHHYGYTTAFKQLQDIVVAPATVTGHTSGNVLLKHDLESGAVEEHRFEHGAAGEAVFAPASLSACEDEGYLTAYAHDLDGAGRIW